VQPTHVASDGAELFVQPTADATRLRSLSPGTRLTFVRSDGEWTLVARDGLPLGFVSNGKLQPLR
jgi:hypothetical protein